MSRANDLYERLRTQGEGAIDEFIADRASEELFLDFKTKPAEGDKRNVFSKAISGFGNSEGGIVVWGVHCRETDQGDVAQGKRPFENPQKFKSWLEGAVSGCTIPPHAGVQHQWIPSLSEAGRGFVVTLVPQAPNFPLQHAMDKRYYMRAGSSFEPIPHGVLAAMFGRPLHASLKHDWEVHQVGREESHTNTMTILATLRIYNEGPAVARDLFANIKVVNKLQNECRCNVSLITNNHHWHLSTTHGRVHAVISNENVRLPPGGMLEALNVDLRLPGPPKEALILECTVGCGNGAPHRFIVNRSSIEIAEIRNNFFAAFPSEQSYNQKSAKSHGRKIFDSASNTSRQGGAER